MTGRVQKFLKTCSSDDTRGPAATFGEILPTLDQKTIWAKFGQFRPDMSDTGQSRALGTRHAHRGASIVARRDESHVAAQPRGHTRSSRFGMRHAYHQAPREGGPGECGDVSEKAGRVVCCLESTVRARVRVRVDDPRLAGCRPELQPAEEACQKLAPACRSDQKRFTMLSCLAMTSSLSNPRQFSSCNSSQNRQVDFDKVCNFRPDTWCTPLSCVCLKPALQVLVLGTIFCSFFLLCSFFFLVLLVKNKLGSLLRRATLFDKCLELCVKKHLKLTGTGVVHTNAHRTSRKP